MKSDTEKIDEIMNEFNFAKVHEVMQKTKWVWGPLNGKIKTPAIKDIKAEARRLMI